VTAIVGFTIASSTAPWQAVGLRIDDGVAWVGGVRFRFVEPNARGDVPSTAPSTAASTALVGWTLSGSPSQVALIDGLASDHDDDLVPLAWTHELGATSVDHVVVTASSIERTCGAIEATTGEPLKRIREAGAIRQGFHRLGPVIVEVVEDDRVVAPTATFWGVVLIVDDLHDVAGRLGPDVISLPKPAVQPGRFIASFREAAGLGLPLALMSA